MMIRKKNKSIVAYLFVFVIAIFFITVFSKCSPLYAFNNSPDATVIFEVGRRMFDGSVLYRDVVDQKGPFLFVIYGIASLISTADYIGLYFIEILFAFLTLTFVYKIASLKFPMFKSVLCTMLVASVMYCYPLNTYGGDTAELMMMPFLMYLYYLGFRYVYKNVKIKPYEYLIVGITSGCVLWSKYTLLGIYLAWFVFPAIDMIKAKRIDKLFKTVLIIIAGVLISSIPWIIYFGANNYLVEFLKFYFLEQARYYQKADLVRSLSNGVRYTFIYMFVPIIGLFGAILYFIKTKKELPKKLVSYNLLMYVVLFIFIYLIGNGGRYPYYFIVLLVFIVPGFMAVVYCLELLVSKMKKDGLKKLFVASFCVLICVITSISYSSTIHYINENEEETPYYQFAQYIDEQNKSKTVTVCGNCIDSAPFFKYMDCFEDFKYVSPLNAGFPDMIEHYRTGLQNGTYDYVICVFDDSFCKDNPKYQFVKKTKYFYQGYYVNFYLYERCVA